MLQYHRSIARLISRVCSELSRADPIASEPLKWLSDKSTASSIGSPRTVSVVPESLLRERSRCLRTVSAENDPGIDPERLPFVSYHCKLIQLGVWLAAAYTEMLEVCECTPYFWRNCSLEGPDL